MSSANRVAFHSLLQKLRDAWTQSSPIGTSVPGLVELQKPGVGLYVDLGEVLDLYGVNLTLLESDADLEIRIAPEADAAPTGSEEDWDVVATVTSAEETVEIEFEDEAASRFLLVWFTRLPPVDGDFSGGIAEVEVLG